MNFNDATDRLCANLSLEDVARATGRPAQSLRQARLDTGHANYRPPPRNWEQAVAKLARRRAGELTKLADQLERGR